MGEYRGAQPAHRSGVVGSIIGKVKGVLIRVGIGNSGSTAHRLSARGPSVRVPAQTELEFTLQDAVTFTLPPR